MSIYLVERFARSLSPAGLASEGRAISESTHARHLGSLLVRGDEGALCAYEAPSLEELEGAMRRRCLPHSRIVVATFVPGIDPTTSLWKEGL